MFGKPVVLVKFQRAPTSEQLKTWLEANPGTYSARKAMLDIIIEDIITQLTNTLGRPRHAIQTPGVHPPLYDWVYAPNFRLSYVVERKTAWFARPRYRITIIYLSLDGVDRESP